VNSKRSKALLVETPNLLGIACWAGVVVAGIYLVGEFAGRFL
jgi:hypothetical protein